MTFLVLIFFGALQHFEFSHYENDISAGKIWGSSTAAAFETGADF
ncbi:hypothetical protein [Pantoea sp. 18069]|nr:hypothetical protein [Pantoea sp. 18069]